MSIAGTGSGGTTLCLIVDNNVNLVASQGFGDGKWLVSARWNLGSGLPFTQSQGYYQAPSTGGALMGTISRQTLMKSASFCLNSTKGVCPRTTASTSTSIALGRRSVAESSELSAGVTNAYSRENVFYINRITGQRKNQLPFLPSVGLDWAF